MFVGSAKMPCNGAMIAVYHEVTNLAIVVAFSVAFGGFNTPKAGLLRSVAAILGRASDKGWDVDREMIGWGQGGRLALLPCDDDGDTKVSDE